MILFLLLAVISLSVAFGFVKSRQRRQVDSRHFAAFVGFSAALVAIAAVSLGVTLTIRWFGPAYYHPVRQAFVGVFGIIATIAMIVTFVAGLLSKGVWRAALVFFVPAVLLVYLLNGFANFGN